MAGLGADRRYWEGLEAGELLLPRCGACDMWHWPARFRCGECGSWEIDWQPVEMSGAIYSWTRTWHPFAGTETLGHPYCTVSVELPQAGSIRLFGLLDAPDAAAIGVKVQGRVANSHVLGRDVPAIRWQVAA
jgi:uncharacterized OB-fold protein